LTDTAPSPELRPVTSRLRFGTPRTVAALILREMSSTYGRTPGGYIWTILEPALGVALLSVVFSLALRNPQLGSNFPIYYATGLMPFYMYQTVSTNVAQSINYSRALLAYPRVTFADAILARLILAVITQLLVSALVLGGIVMIFETRTVFEVPQMLLAYSMAICLGAGVGVTNCFLMAVFPVWQSAWSILTRPLILISGVFFLLDTVPSPYREWLFWNPIAHVISATRGAFYHSYDAVYVSPVYVFTISGVAAFMGMMFLRRYNRDIREL